MGSNTKDKNLNGMQYQISPFRENQIQAWKISLGKEMKENEWTLSWSQIKHLARTGMNSILCVGLKCHKARRGFTVVFVIK